MKHRFVDANIFLELLYRNEKKQSRCLDFVKKNKDLWTTALVIIEIEWVLRSAYEEPKERILKFFEELFRVRDLEIENKALIAEVVELYSKINIDFTDCFNVVLARKKGISEFVSYDRDFDKIPKISRLEP